MTSKVVCFSGPKYSGKDTTASVLIDCGYIRHNFADPVKRAAKEIFMLSDAELTNPITKEIKLDRWPYLSPREILQRFATEAMRSEFPGIWVERWKVGLERLMVREKHNLIVCTDLRFPDELKMLSDLLVPTQIIFIEASYEGYKTENEYSNHESESYFERIRERADLIIKNEGTVEGLRSKVLQLMQGGII